MGKGGILECCHCAKQGEREYLEETCPYLPWQRDPCLDNISHGGITGLHIPNGISLVYELDDAIKPIRHYDLGGRGAGQGRNDGGGARQIRVIYKC